MDESRSWMGYSKETKARENACNTSCRLNRGYKTDVNKAWNNATVGKSKMGRDTSKTKTKARDNVSKTPRVYTKCCVGDCKYDTMDQIVGHGTREEISQEIHFALLKMHIELFHTTALEQTLPGQPPQTPPTLAPKRGRRRTVFGIPHLRFNKKTGKYEPQTSVYDPGASDIETSKYEPQTSVYEPRRRQMSSYRRLN